MWMATADSGGGVGGVGGAERPESVENGVRLQLRSYGRGHLASATLYDGKERDKVPGCRLSEVRVWGFRIGVGGLS